MKDLLHYLLFLMLCMFLDIGYAEDSLELRPNVYSVAGLDVSKTNNNQGLSESIDPFSGVLQHHYVDIHLPGNGGFDLDVIRHYKSSFTESASYQGRLGLGWDIHFGRVINKVNRAICAPARVAADLNPVLELPDGSTQLFVFNTSTVLMTTQRWKAECLSTGGILVYAPNGTRYEMTQRVSDGGGIYDSWYATKIYDKNNNYINIKYVSSTSEINTVSTSNGS